MTEDEGVAILTKAQERLTRQMDFSTKVSSITSRITVFVWAVFSVAVPAFFAGLAIWGLIWVMDNVFKMFGWR